MSEEFSTINITSVSYPFPPGSREQLRKAARKIVRAGDQGVKLPPGHGQTTSLMNRQHLLQDLYKTKPVHIPAWSDLAANLRKEKVETTARCCKADCTKKISGRGWPA